jgi:hypothetical protein
MARTYKLGHFNKGTGAAVEPIDERRKADGDGKLNTVRVPSERAKSKARGEKRSAPLPPGHVRKKTTGELGRVQAVDPKAGTATVLWLRDGRTSTVPLSAVSRR